MLPAGDIVSSAGVCSALYKVAQLSGQIDVVGIHTLEVFFVIWTFHKCRHVAFIERLTPEYRDTQAWTFTDEMNSFQSLHISTANFRQTAQISVIVQPISTPA